MISQRHARVVLVVLSPSLLARSTNAQANKPTEEEIERVTTERACIKDYPWPWPELEGAKTPKEFDQKFHARFSKLNATEMGKIWEQNEAGLANAAYNATLLKHAQASTKDEDPAKHPDNDVRELAKNLTAAQVLEKIGALSSDELRCARFVLRGKDIEQVRLYGDFLYLWCLVREKQYEQVVKVAKTIFSKRPLKFKGVTDDWTVNSTYYSKEALGNMICLCEYQAKAKSLPPHSEEVSKLAANFLDHHSGLRPLLRVPSVDPTETLLTREEAIEPFQTYCRKIVNDRSTKNMRLFNVMKQKDGYTIDFPDSPVHVTSAEVEELNRGKPLSDDHAFSKAIRKSADSSLVLFANPFMLKPSQWQTEGDNFAFAIQRAYPEIRVYRDPLTDKTDERAKELTACTLPGPTGVAAVVADESFEVVDGNVIADLTGQGMAFDKAGIKVIKFNGERGDPAWNGGKRRVVIVITGHSNEKLARYVRALGEAGYLDGNDVIFNSCAKPLTRELSFEITERYKARAVFCYQGNILARDVKKAMGAFAAKLKAAVEAGERLPDFLRKIIRDSALNGVWQISRTKSRREECSYV